MRQIRDRPQFTNRGPYPIEVVPVQTTRLRPVQVLLSLAFCVAFCATPRSALWAQFADSRIELIALAGATKNAQTATGLPFLLHADASESHVCGHDNPLFDSTATANVKVGAQGSGSLLQLEMSAFGYVSVGLELCSASGSGQGSLSFTATGPLYETLGGADLTMTGPQNATFSESRWPGSAEGVASSIARSYSVPVGSIAGGSEKVVVWSIGEPAGFLGTPYPPISLAPGEQLFTEPTPGNAATEGGVRFQAPNISAAISKGFDLTADGPNPFTAFRFPEVPAGADNHFTLTLGVTEIMGLAGETVNLRQYAPAGFSALSLRGDLTPFLPAAVAPDAAVPIGGGPPRQLVFGLAFAQPGIAGFTLKPVPEPSGWALMIFASLAFAFAHGAAQLRQRTGLSEHRSHRCTVALTVLALALLSLCPDSVHGQGFTSAGSTVLANVSVGGAEHAEQAANSLPYFIAAAKTKSGTSTGCSNPNWSSWGEASAKAAAFGSDRVLAIDVSATAWLASGSGKCALEATSQSTASLDTVAVGAVFETKVLQHGRVSLVPSFSDALTASVVESQVPGTGIGLESRLQTTVSADATPFGEPVPLFAPL